MRISYITRKGGQKIKILAIDPGTHYKFVEKELKRQARLIEKLQAQIGQLEEVGYESNNIS